MTDVSLRPATGDSLDAVVSLLSANDLPTDDVRDGDAAFFLAVDGDERVGVAGLEPCGDDALLRSVVVPEGQRGEGYGAAVVDAAVERARERGTRRLYLLTTTAADFFAANGFERVPRDAVPDPVSATREFSELCPDAATCMSRPV